MRLKRHEKHVEGEPRYNAETVRQIAALAARLQSQQQEGVTAQEMEAIGAEVGLESAFIRQALAHLTRGAGRTGGPCASGRTREANSPGSRLVVGRLGDAGQRRDPAATVGRWCLHGRPDLARLRRLHRHRSPALPRVGRGRVRWGACRTGLRGGSSAPCVMMRAASRITLPRFAQITDHLSALASFGGV
jgi:hypothetical protein